MYKLLATDMDETLLARGGVIPQDNMDAVRAMVDDGVHFVPCSGRGFDSIMLSLQPMVEAGLSPDYVISLNGGCITRVEGTEHMGTHTLGNRLAKRVLDLSLEFDLCFHAYILNGPVWIHNINADEREFLDGRMLFEEFFDDDLDFLADEPIAKCLVELTDFDKLHQIGDNLVDSGYGDLVRDCEIVFSSNRYLEFCPGGVNKGTGLASLAEILCIEMSQTIGCGDSNNDISLIRDAGLGVGAHNVTPDVAPFCDYICERDCDEGIMAEVYDKFLRNHS